jgi:hypothetical protein
VAEDPDVVIRRTYVTNGKKSFRTKKFGRISGQDGLRVQIPVASCAESGTDTENRVSVGK